MDKVEELLRSRKWAPDCLRVNIAQPDQIITRGTTGKVKIAKVRSNLLRKNEHGAPGGHKVHRPRVVGRRDAGDPEPQRAVQATQRQQQQGALLDHFHGDFTGGALCFDDGVRIEEQYTWHKMNGHVYHWNEPHEGEKFSIVLYRNGSKKTKIQQIQEAIKKKQNRVVPEEPKPDATTVEHREAVKRLVDAVTEIAKKDGDVELKELVSKLLDPLRELVQSIPDPA
jgi:hypothetical protein